MNTKKKSFKSGSLVEFKINFPMFLKEVFDNNPTLGGQFKVPVNVLQKIMIEVAERASELNDPVMNALMCRLALYAECDHYDKANYNAAIVKKTLGHPEYVKWKKPTS